MRNAVTTTSLLGLLGLALLAGCPDRTISKVNPNQGRVEFKDIPVSVNRDIDILFVIDDSNSMADKQTNLKNNFPNFINVLNTIEGGLPNVHLGVVTSDLGTKGADDAQAGPSVGSGIGACLNNGGKNGNLQTSSVVTGAFISDTKNTDGTRSTNYSGSLEDAFSAIASVGVNGCGFEQHLEAAKRALDGNPQNAGFLRPNAYLALIFIQDEDDCSMAHSSLLGSDTTTLGPLQSFRCNRFGHVCAQGGQNSDQMNQTGPKGECASNENSAYLTKVGDYVDYFKSLKSDPANVIVAGIAGPTTPYEVELRAPPNGGTAIPQVAHSCTYNGASGQEVADPSTRLKQFLDQFPNRSTFSTICQQDLSGALIQIAQLLRTVIGSPCIEGNLADVDPNTDGPQYDCSVSDVTNYGKANQTEQVLPQCNGSSPDYTDSTNKPCWSIQTDTMNCMVAPNLTLKIVRDQAPPDNTHVISYCVTEA
ncbi:MAG TPA: hypothetical protein VFS15_10880 [Kofleriaceae bacterium]|nr:hypothetical protein [Kofleriaceae bacterium]